VNKLYKDVSGNINSITNSFGPNDTL